MAELSERLATGQRALLTLEQALAMPFSVIVRDATIQRFEYSFEITWKLLKTYLAEAEGIVCNSPKRCFREALQVGLLSIKETETCLIMTDDRNLASHTYIEQVAQSIYTKLPVYLKTMNALVHRIATNVAAENNDKE